MPMSYEQFKPPQNNLNAPNSGRIKIGSEDFLIYDVPGDSQVLPLNNIGLRPSNRLCLSHIIPFVIQ